MFEQPRDVSKIHYGYLTIWCVLPIYTYIMLQLLEMFL